MVFAFGAFTFDSDRLELRRDGIVVPAERRPLEVLAALVRRRDRIVSKEELFAEVWRAEHVSDAALARAVSDLRGLVGDTEPRKAIVQTVYGVGYRFIAPVAECVASLPDSAGRPERRASRLLAWAIPAAAAVGMAVFSLRDVSPLDASSRALLAHLARSPDRAVCRPETRPLLERLEQSERIADLIDYAWLQYARAVVCEQAHAGPKAMKAAERALVVFPGEPRAVALVATMLAERGRAEEAYARLEPALKSRPDDPDLHFRAAYVLPYGGALEQAEAHLAEALRLHPRWTVEHIWAPRVLFYRGKYRQFVSLIPSQPASYFQFHAGMGELAAGERAEARRLFALAAAEERWSLYPGAARAAVAALDGRSTEARCELAAVERWRRGSSGEADGEETFTLAQLYGLIGDPPSALDRLRVAVAQGFVAAPAFEQDPFLAEVRALDGYAAVLATASVRREAFARRFALVGTGLAKPSS